MQKKMKRLKTKSGDSKKKKKRKLLKKRPERVSRVRIIKDCGAEGSEPMLDGASGLDPRKTSPRKTKGEKILFPILFLCFHNIMSKLRLRSPHACERKKPRLRFTIYIYNLYGDTYIGERAEGVILYWTLLPASNRKNAYDAWKRKENVKNNNNVSCAISEAAEEVGLEQN